MEIEDDTGQPPIEDFGDDDDDEEIEINLEHTQSNIEPRLPEIELFEDIDQSELKPRKTRSTSKPAYEYKYQEQSYEFEDEFDPAAFGEFQDTEEAIQAANLDANGPHYSMTELIPQFETKQGFLQSRPQRSTKMEIEKKSKPTSSKTITPQKRTNSYSRKQRSTKRQKLSHPPTNKVQTSHLLSQKKSLQYSKKKQNIKTSPTTTVIKKKHKTNRTVSPPPIPTSMLKKNTTSSSLISLKKRSMSPIKRHPYSRSGIVNKSKQEKKIKKQSPISKKNDVKQLKNQNCKTNSKTSTLSKKKASHTPGQHSHNSSTNRKVTISSTKKLSTTNPIKTQPPPPPITVKQHKTTIHSTKPKATTMNTSVNNKKSVKPITIRKKLPPLTQPIKKIPESLPSTKTPPPDIITQPVTFEPPQKITFEPPPDIDIEPPPSLFGESSSEEGESSSDEDDRDEKNRQKQGNSKNKSIIENFENRNHEIEYEHSDEEEEDVEEEDLLALPEGVELVENSVMKNLKEKQKSKSKLLITNTKKRNVENRKMDDANEKVIKNKEKQIDGDEDPNMTYADPENAFMEEEANQNEEIYGSLDQNNMMYDENEYDPDQEYAYAVNGEGDYANYVNDPNVEYVAEEGYDENGEYLTQQEADGGVAGEEYDYDEQGNPLVDENGQLINQDGNWADPQTYDQQNYDLMDAQGQQQNVEGGIGTEGGEITSLGIDDLNESGDLDLLLQADLSQLGAAVDLNNTSSTVDLLQQSDALAQVISGVEANNYGVYDNYYGQQQVIPQQSFNNSKAMGEQEDFEGPPGFEGPPQNSEIEKRKSTSSLTLNALQEMLQQTSNALPSLENNENNENNEANENSKTEEMERKGHHHSVRHHHHKLRRHHHHHRPSPRKSMSKQERDIEGMNRFVAHRDKAMRQFDREMKVYLKQKFEVRKKTIDNRQVQFKINKVVFPFDNELKKFTYDIFHNRSPDYFHR